MKNRHLRRTGAPSARSRILVFFEPPQPSLIAQPCPRGRGRGFLPAWASLRMAAISPCRSTLSLPRSGERTIRSTSPRIASSPACPLLIEPARPVPRPVCGNVGHIRNAGGLAPRANPPAPVRAPPFRPFFQKKALGQRGIFCAALSMVLRASSLSWPLHAKQRTKRDMAQVHMFPGKAPSGGEAPRDGQGYSCDSLIRAWLAEVSLPHRRTRSSPQTSILAWD